MPGINYRRPRERLCALPGLESKAYAVVALLENDEWDPWVAIEGYTPRPEERPDPHMQYASPELFKTLKIPKVLGRGFTDREVAGAAESGVRRRQSDRPPHRHGN